MKRRIRAHQAIVGMFVQEMESEEPQALAARGFLIASDIDVRRIHSSRIISLVIDTDRGVDLGSVDGSARIVDAAGLEAELRNRFSKRELAAARVTISQTTPIIKGMFCDARLSGLIDMEQAGNVAEQIVGAAQDNAAAMVGVARLKDKDQGTFLHSLAVSALMASFGRALGFEDGEVHTLALAGLLHDIGKICLPDEILHANRQLSDAEYAIVRTHPEQGRRLLGPYSEMPKPVLDVCLYHHEHYDGSGYPAGLVGHDIPYVARLAAVCDVYDALTTVRPYKHAWSQAAAVGAMMQSRGHFDPVLLNQFVSKLVISGEL